MISTMTQLLKINLDKTSQGLPSLFIQALCLPGWVLLLALTQQVDAKEPSQIVKWKDDKGVTHYGDTIPAQYANRDNSIISQQGITVKRNKAINYQAEALDLAKQEQAKKDKALLSAFTNENEIDLARDRNLQLDQLIIDNLQLQKSNSQKRLADNRNYADGFIKRKKPIPADLSADLKTNQAEIARQDQLIAERKAAMEATRKRFDEDKKRYIALKNRTNLTDALQEAPVTVKP